MTYADYSIRLIPACLFCLFYYRWHTFIFGHRCFLLHGRDLNDCLTIGSGFGYYSLSSVLIADIKSATLGPQGAAELATIALLANVIREMIALFGTPVLARWGGRLVPISVAGINSMDVCLPMIVRSSYKGEELIPIAILHGIALEVSVPFLINAFC